MSLPIGFHDIPESVYHAQTLLDRPALSSSIAKTLILKSPLHAWHTHPKLGGNAKEETDAMDYGTIAHALILGKGAEKIAVADYDDWRKKEAQAFRDTAYANGQTPILRCKLAAIEEMVEAFHKQTRAMCPEFYAPGRLTEQCAIWETGGVLCQSMFDGLLIHGGEIFDLKSTTDANPDVISRQVVKLGYDIQSAFYRRAVESLFPRLAGRTRFRFIFFESSPPYAVTPVELDGEAEMIGESKVNRALALWADCLERNYWPAYVTATARISVPAYALADELAKSLPDYDIPKPAVSAAAEELFDY